MLRKPVLPTVGAVDGRPHPSEDRAHRGLGPGRLADRVLEQRRAIGEGVDSRGDRPRVAVAAQMVGTQGIDHVDQDVGAGVAQEALGPVNEKRPQFLAVNKFQDCVL